MADSNKVVDAVSSVPVVGPQANAVRAVNNSCNMNAPKKDSTASTTNVPLKLDAASSAAMAQMLQQMAASQSGEVQYRNVNPADIIFGAGQRMTAIYSRFNVLQELGKHLNGLKLSDQLPDTLAIEDVSITFRAKGDNGQFGEPQTAVIKNLACVGDLSALLSTEMGIMILTLQQEITGLLDIAQKSEEHYGKMRKMWETANPDRVIKPIEEATAQPAATEAPAAEQK